MNKLFITVPLSWLAISLVSGCALLSPANEDLPLVPIPESTSTSLDEFNVRGYVIAIVNCPPLNMCIRADGVDIASQPVTAEEPDYLEKMRMLRDRGEVMTLPIGLHRRYGLKVGREYLFSFRKGDGAVGVSALN